MNDDHVYAPEECVHFRFHARLPSWLTNNLASPTGKGVSIGVVDSGWDRTQANPQIQVGIGLVDPQDELSLKESQDDHDRIGHGTACADLILSMAPRALIVPIRVFGSRLESSVDVINEGIRWGIKHSLRLLNLSLGTIRPEALNSMYIACEEARRSGLIIVAARDNATSWSYPSIFDNVIGVVSGDFEDRYHFTYRAGDAIECIGKGNFAGLAWGKGRPVAKSGNSFAAANMTGIVALLLERYPHASIEDVRSLLSQFSTPQ
jgi:subtilisin